MQVITEIDNNFGYEKITQLVDNIPLKNKVQLFVVFILPWLKIYKGGNSLQRKTLQGG
jgi:hypothetical protein